MGKTIFMPNISEEKLIVIVAALSQLTVQLVANMATVIIPEIAMELGISASLQLYINITYLCSMVAVGVPIAKVITRYGVKKSIKICCWMLIISLLLCGFGVNFYMILAARLIQGLCCATLGICIYTMLVEELEDEPLGTALGLVGSSGYVGLMLAPSLTGFITFFFDWRVPFLILIPFFLVQLIILSQVKSEWVGEKLPIDNIGTLIYILIMILFTLGLTEMDSPLIICFIASLILVPIFIKYEKKKENPVLNVGILKNVKIMIGLFAGMATYFVTTIAITILTYHMVYPLSMDLSFVGMIMLVTPLTMVVVSIIAGKLSGKYDPRMISGFALLLIFVSIVMYAFLEYLPIELLILACLIQGVGHGFFSSPNNKYVLTLPDEKEVGDTSALLSTSKEFGKIMSSGIYTLIIAFMLGDVVLGPVEYNAPLMYSNYLMMVICVVILVAAAGLLFYSKYKYERYENENILRMVYNLIPAKYKESAREALNITETAVDTTLKLKDVMNVGNVVNTSKVKDIAVNIKDTTVETATAIKDTTVDTATAIKDTTVETATAIKDTTVDTATVLKDTTVDTTIKLKDTTVETATNLKDTTIDTATNLKDTTVDTTKKLKDTTVDTATNLKDTTVDTTIKLKDTTIDTATNLKDTTKDTATNIKDKLTEKK